MEAIATLVACSKSKREERTVSWQLYNSTLFQKSWAAASAIGHPYVVSAKHHLLGPTERVDDYNETLKTKTKAERDEWADVVVSQLDDHYDAVVVFGGRDYVDPLFRAFGDVRFFDPYEQTSGNGQQMSVADEITRRVYDGEPFDKAINNAVWEVCLV